MTLLLTGAPPPLPNRVDHLAGGARGTSLAEIEIGVAAGVPYVLRPPSTPRADAPAAVAWHLLDGPRTPEAFATALPIDPEEA